MQTSEISSIAGGSPDSVGAAPDLGRDEFLRMLIAQLENQDPLDPQDATEFTAQLAQFTSLDQLVSMRASIDSLARAQTSGQALSAASLIGRDVVVEGSDFEVSADPAATLPALAIEAGEATRLLRAEIVDASGRVVAKADAFDLAAGRTSLAWSRFDRTPGPGAYSLRVTPEAGAALPRSLVGGRVSGASFVGTSAMLLVGSSEVPLSALREVRS